jgi:hypothetical protein
MATQDRTAAETHAAFGVLRVLRGTHRVLYYYYYYVGRYYLRQRFAAEDDGGGGQDCDGRGRHVPAAPYIRI